MCQVDLDLVRINSSRKYNQQTGHFTLAVIPLVVAISILIPVFAVISVLFLRRIRNLKVVRSHNISRSYLMIYDTERDSRLN